MRSAAVPDNQPPVLLLHRGSSHQVHEHAQGNRIHPRVVLDSDNRTWGGNEVGPGVLLLDEFVLLLAAQAQRALPPLQQPT